MTIIFLVFTILTCTYSAYISLKIYRESQNPGDFLIFWGFLALAGYFPLCQGVHTFPVPFVRLTHYLNYLAVLLVIYGSSYTTSVRDKYILESKNRTYTKILLINTAFILVLTISALTLPGQELLNTLGNIYFYLASAIVFLYCLYTAATATAIKEKNMTLPMLLIVAGDFLLTFYSPRPVIFIIGNILVWCGVFIVLFELFLRFTAHLHMRFGKIIEHKNKSIEIIEYISRPDFINTSLQKNIAKIFSLLLDSLEFSAGAIYLCTPDTDELTLLWSYGLFPPNQPVKKNLLVRDKDIEGYIAKEKIKFGQGLIGCTAERNTHIIITDFSGQDEFPQTLPDIVRIEDCISKPVVFEDTLLGICTCINKSNKSYTRDDLELFTMFTNYVGETIHSYQVQSENLEKKLIEEDLKIARDIQESLVPKKIPEFPGLTIGSNYQAAKEVGGDYYDIVRVSDNLLAVIIADVSGKGVSAALIMAIFRSLVRAGLRHFSSIKETFTSINYHICDDIPAGMFITSMFGIFNQETRSLELVNGGHNPLIYKPSGADAQEVKVPGMAIGFRKGELFDTCIQVHTLDYKPGDFFFFYTDGVNEAMDKDGNEFGYDQLIKCINLQSAKTGVDFIDALKQQIDRHTKGYPQSDDISCVSINVTG